MIAPVVVKLPVQQRVSNNVQVLVVRRAQAVVAKLAVALVMAYAKISAIVCVKAIAL